MSIHAVPREILNLIFLNLEPFEAVQAKQICKAWKQPAEEAAKCLLVKEFHALIDPTSILFQKMTKKTIYEFEGDLDQKRNYSQLSSKEIHDRLNASVIRLDCRIVKTCWLTKKKSRSFEENSRDRDNPENRFFIHIDIGELSEKEFRNLSSTHPLYNKLAKILHYPRELFEIREGEQTALPIDGKLVILTARQLCATCNERFEDVLKSIRGIYKATCISSTHYCVERDGPSFRE